MGDVVGSARSSPENEGERGWGGVRRVSETVGNVGVWECGGQSRVGGKAAKRANDNNVQSSDLDDVGNPAHG